MLHRSFKPVKCKTSLKLASSRIKLLKNRKDVQVKQMKKELAQLLESGQEQTARIRVEHVIREEKMKSAYDLLELYCELIAARMQIIESQKNCPIDLKEAIASVVFASPRCSDVTELQDVRKHFIAKYGKEFVSAAVELRPESGVSRMIVEKLSAKTPDGHEKIKILKEIAEEHNVKWNAKSLEQVELKPAQDLLNGPNTFEKAKIIVQTDPPRVQAAAPTTSQSPQVFAGAGHYQQTSFKQPEIVSSPRVKNQNVEFENAVAAAKAAAESAEIACRAAKEAAELARQAKHSRQSSTELKKSSLLIDSRNEEIRKEDGKEFSNVKNPSLRVEDKDKDTRPNLSDSLRSKTSADGTYQNEEKNTLYRKQQSSFIEERIVKQGSSVSMHSNINNYGDEDDQRSYNHPNVGFHVEPATSVVFDDFGSDDDNNVFDKKPSSPPPTQPDKLLPVRFDDFGSDDDNNVLDKKPFVNNINKPSSPPTQPDKLLPVTFDDPDGPSSDTEDEGDKYPLIASNKFNPQPSKNVNIQDPEPVLTKKDSWKKNMYPSNDKARVGVKSSFDDAETQNEFGSWFDRELNFDDEPADPPQSKEMTISKSDYGNLRGGLKHRPPPLPYTKKASDSDSDDSNAVPLRRQSPNIKKESVKVNSGKEVNTSEPEEDDNSSQVSSKLDHVGTTLSQRTKLTPKYDGRSDKISSTEEERVDNSESWRTSYNPKPKQEKPISFRQRTEPAPSKSLDEERLGYSEANSDKTSSTTYYDPKPRRPKPTSFRRKTESETFVEEKPVNSETRSDRISSKTEPAQSSYNKTMDEEKPKMSEARSDIVSSRTSKPTITPQRMPEEKSEKFDTNDPKPHQQKPTSLRQRTEPNQPRKDTAKLSTSSIEQPTSSLMKKKEEEKSEIPKTSSTEEGLSSESSIKKASHVHPKLPDYDAIAACLQALRVNRG